MTWQARDGADREPNGAVTCVKAGDASNLAANQATACHECGTIYI